MKNGPIKVFIAILLLSVMAVTFSGCFSSDPSPEVQEYHDRIAELEYELDLEYQRGLDHGYENGYSDGYKDGYSDGESYGYEGGFMDGAEAGYAYGYADCESGY